MTLLPTVLALLACAAVIYLACEYFVNGIEWVGLRFGVSQSAVGTVLAAFGTALPESVVTFVAVATGGSAQQKQIGVGAAIGGPLVLGTIAYAVVGLSYLAFHGTQNAPLLKRGEQRRLARDQAWFLLIFAAKVGLGLVAFRYKPWLGWAFVGGYALYTWRAITAGEELGKAEVELEPLKFRPTDSDPPAHWALLQTLLALAVIFFSSQLFVRALALLSPQLGISTQLTALLLSPIATELPEIAQRDHLAAPGQDHARARQHQRSDDDSGDDTGRARHFLHALAARSRLDDRRRRDLGVDRADVDAAAQGAAHGTQARAVRTSLFRVRGARGYVSIPSILRYSS